MRNILFFVLLLGTNPLIAQIIITNESFLRVGDTLLTAIDNLPANLNITPPGPDQRWDYTALQAPFTRQTIVRPIGEGPRRADFAAATFTLPLSNDTETYYRVTNTLLQLVGVYGEAPANLGMKALMRFQPPIIERRAPMRYRDENQMDAAMSLLLDANDLPPAVLQQLPLTPDSLRIRIKIARKDVVDAWGKLTVPGGIYNVLREKRIEIRETRLDVKVSAFPWQDISDLIPHSELTGRDTTVYYAFFSNEVKEPVAIVTMDKSEQRPIQVVYKANDQNANIQNVKTLKPSVYAFPNPAIVNVRFEFSNLPVGYYKLVLYNIIGTEVWSQQYYINGQRTERVDVSNFRKGTYLYSLRNEQGHTIATKRIVVVRP
ncbi:MAG TPA: T9SS type A sorting domain-containing protein [Saprospiraceae bacterium]|nr:T9SS type A sorting domain-containing protein [Saprospiraceae bacterium]